MRDISLQGTVRLTERSLNLMSDRNEMWDRFRVAIVGCGNISQSYGAALQERNDLELLGAFDRNPGRSAAFCSAYGGTPYPALEALLHDPRLDVVVVLTPHSSHAEIVRQCLHAGKHVHVEKPMAASYKEACELVALAEEKHLRLGASPFVFLGEAHRAAITKIRSGGLGEVRLIYAEANWGRIESWHPNPRPFHEIGALWDVGIYPLTVLTAFFGRVRRVSAFAQTLLAERRDKTGRAFPVGYPDYVCANLEFASGPLCRLTAGFYAHRLMTRQNGMEFHGDLGSLRMNSWSAPDAEVEAANYGGEFEPVPYVRPRSPGVDWAAGVVEIASALNEERSHRTGGAHAAHVIGVLEAIDRSFQGNCPQTIHSDFELPVLDGEIPQS